MGGMFTQKLYSIIAEKVDQLCSMYASLWKMHLQMHWLTAGVPLETSKTVAHDGAAKVRPSMTDIIYI